MTCVWAPPQVLHARECTSVSRRWTARPLVIAMLTSRYVRTLLNQLFLQCVRRVSMICHAMSVQSSRPRILQSLAKSAAGLTCCIVGKHAYEHPQLTAPQALVSVCVCLSNVCLFVCVCVRSRADDDAINLNMDVDDGANFTTC